MKKLKIIISVAFLAALSVVVDFITALTNKPTTPRSDYPILLVAGSIAVIMILGSMFWGVYAYFHKRQNPNAFNFAFWVYVFFAFCILGIGMYKFPEAIKIRDRNEFIYFYKTRIERLTHEKVNLKIRNRTDISLKQQEDIEACLSINIRYNEALIDRMIASETLVDFFFYDQELNSQLEECIEIYETDTD